MGLGRLRWHSVFATLSIRNCWQCAGQPSHEGPHHIALNGDRVDMYALNQLHRAITQVFLHGLITTTKLCGVTTLGDHIAFCFVDET